MTLHFSSKKFLSGKYRNFNYLSTQKGTNPKDFLLKTVSKPKDFSLHAVSNPKDFSGAPPTLRIGFPQGLAARFFTINLTRRREIVECPRNEGAALPIPPVSGSNLPKVRPVLGRNTQKVPPVLGKGGNWQKLPNERFVEMPPRSSLFIGVHATHRFYPDGRQAP